MRRMYLLSGYIFFEILMCKMCVRCVFLLILLNLSKVYEIEYPIELRLCSVSLLYRDVYGICWL
jgi:hypothetical protein